MNIQKFWDMIQAAIDHDPENANNPSVKTAQARYKRLIHVLAEMEDKDIVVFNAIWDEYQSIARMTDISDIAKQISKYWNDDDHYEEFPNWLIIQGKAFFRKVLEKPIAIVRHVKEDQDNIGFWGRPGDDAYRIKKNDKEISIDNCPEYDAGIYDLQEDRYLPKNRKYGRFTKAAEEIKEYLYVFTRIHDNKIENIIEKRDEFAKAVGKILEKRLKKYRKKNDD